MDLPFRGKNITNLKIPASKEKNKKKYFTTNTNMSGEDGSFPPRCTSSNSMKTRQMFSVMPFISYPTVLPPCSLLTHEINEFMICISIRLLF